MRREKRQHHVRLAIARYAGVARVDGVIAAVATPAV
jgi:hypothetical protein